MTKWLTGELARLTKAYPFIRRRTIGASWLGSPLHALTIGHGNRAVMYNAAHHANEWLTTVILTRFLEECARSYSKAGWPGEFTLHLIPMVNPDGVDIVTGGLVRQSSAYKAAKAMAGQDFPNCWKANIRGVDLNSNYPAGWELAKARKFAGGYTAPGPRDYVGPAPLSEPESRAVADYTRANDFALTLSLHTQGEEIYWRYGGHMPEGAEELAKRLSAVSGYLCQDVPSESSHAGYRDWFIETYNRPGFTIECGLGENPLPMSQLDGVYEKVSRLLWETVRC